MHRGIDAHRHLVAVLAGDLLVHVEQVAIPLADNAFAQPLDGIRKVEIDAELARADTAAGITGFFGRARGDVPGREIAVARIFPFEIVVAVRLRNRAGRLAAILLALRHPDAARSEEHT